MAPGLFKELCGYDAGSNRKTLTDPSNAQTTYTYDTLNRLTNILDFNNNNFGFGYDALSRRTQLTRPNGISTTYSYDTVSNLLSVLHQQGASTLDGASYTYDSAGNRKSKTNLLNSNTSNFSYDNIYQLTGVTGTVPESYTYDAVGNRLTAQSVSNYSYNNSNQLTSSSVASYTYDNNGNTLSKTVSGSATQYTWDFENRLISVQPPSGGTVSFKYDPFGRRIQKAGATTTNYVYDGAGVVEEVDSSENLLAKYSQGARIDEPLSELRSSAISYYEQDGLGSVSSLSNIGGALANTYVYDSFGNLTASTGSITNPYQYTGRDYDPETGLRYYRARYYDSATGRFLNEDPAGYWIADSNFYVYARNAPTAFNDPTGLCPPQRECPKVPRHPGFGDIDRNIQEAQQMSLFVYVAPLGTSIGLEWFYQQVRNKGPWDYKQAKNLTDFAGTGAPPLDPQSDFEDFGNFNFGATAAALGLPEWFALRGAGWASTKADPERAKFWGHWWGQAPYGDDPDDQTQIMLGYMYYKNHCYKGFGGGW